MLVEEVLFGQFSLGRYSDYEQLAGLHCHGLTDVAESPGDEQ